MTSPKCPWVASALLSIAYGSVVFAGFFAPYNFEVQNRILPFSPPTRIHFFDQNGRFHPRPFVYESRPSSEDPSGYQEDSKLKYPIIFFTTDGNHGADGNHLHLFGTLTPARIFLLGSDNFGRDIFSRLLHGGRVSLIASLGAAAISVGLGLVLGALAGFYGRWTGAVIMRSADVFMGMPWLYLLLAVRAGLPLHMDSRQAYVLLAIVMGAVGWARPARLIRGLVLAAKESEFVLVSRGFGASDVHLMSEHILPSAAGVALVQLSILIPQYILVEISLSFFGLGVNEPIPSWGNMLGNIHEFWANPHWWLFAPAAAVFLILLAYHRLFSYIKNRTS